MNFEIRKATKQAARLRLALIGPSGSGKTYSALAIAKYLNGGKIAVIDTERGSASKYADIFDFDVIELDSFSPKVYCDAIHYIDGLNIYHTLIIDSLSHAWMGKDGALEQVDRIAKRIQSGNSFSAWRDVTPLHNELVDTILRSNMHIIATMRSKTEYSVEKNESGKTVVRKVGLAAVQRDGLEYEFDVVGDMTLENELIVTKTRCPQLSGQLVRKPGKEIAQLLKEWLGGEVKQEAKVEKKETTITQDEKIKQAAKEMEKSIEASLPTSGTADNGKDKITKKQLTLLNTVGTEVYNGKWDDKRKELVLAITHKRTGSSKDLTAEEATRLIEGLQMRIPKDTEETEAAKIIAQAERIEDGVDFGMAEDDFVRRIDALKNQSLKEETLRKFNKLRDRWFAHV